MKNTLTPLEDRFWKFVNKTDACWLWTGTLNGSGYGTIGLGRRDEGKGFAHRVSWQIHHGAIPKEMLVCHQCDCKICVNPDHLFLGTYQDNVDDMISKGRNPKGEIWLTPARVAAQPAGERHGGSKLTETDVKEIFRLNIVEGKSKKSIAKMYGVSYATVLNIITRKNWRRVTHEVALAKR